MPRCGLFGRVVAIDYGFARGQVGRIVSLSQLAMRRRKALGPEKFPCRPSKPNVGAGSVAPAITGLALLIIGSHTQQRVQYRAVCLFPREGTRVKSQTPRWTLRVDGAFRYMFSAAASH